MDNNPMPERGQSPKKPAIQWFAFEGFLVGRGGQSSRSVGVPLFRRQTSGRLIPLSVGNPRQAR